MVLYNFEMLIIKFVHKLHNSYFFRKLFLLLLLLLLYNTILRFDLILRNA